MLLKEGPGKAWRWLRSRLAQGFRAEERGAPPPEAAESKQGSLGQPLAQHQALSLRSQSVPRLLLGRKRMNETELSADLGSTTCEQSDLRGVLAPL